MSGSAFGERLRTLRKEAHLTQQQVADILRIHRTTYTKYETGVVAPDQQGLLELAKLFEVSIDYLLGRSTGRCEVAEKKDAEMDLTLQEQLLVQMFRQMNYMEQQQVIKQATDAFRRRQKK